MNTFPFAIESTCWNDLTESQRDFFHEEYLPLPKDHASQIQLLKPESVSRVGKWLNSSIPNWWPECGPFRGDVKFTNQQSIKINADNWRTDEGIQKIRQQLHDLGIPYARKVFLLYETKTFVLPWKLVVRYWDAFAWDVGYQMWAMDHTRQWLICFHHEDAIFFGSFAGQAT